MSARTFVLALVVGVLVVPTGGRASDGFRKEIRSALAEPIKVLLKEEKQESIAVGEFTGPAQLDSQAGPGIQQQLSEELTAIKVTVNKKAALSVKGRYAKVNDEKSPGRIAVKLTAEIYDSN